MTLRSRGRILLGVERIPGSRDHRLAVRGLDMHYLEWGDAAAPPMVLLHGLTGHAHTWDHAAALLAERYRLIVPDQRGHGDTSHAERYDTAEFVADLDALAGALALAPFVLAGISMGGHNAMAYAAVHPQAVRRLVVIDIPPRMDRTHAPNWAVISRLAESGHQPFDTFEQAVEAARAGNPTAPERNLRYRTHWNLNTAADGRLLLKYDPKAPARWEPADLTADLPRIAAPTLLVRGGLTNVLPAEVARRMVAAMPDAELVEVPDSGHSVPTDRPEALAALMLDWLARRG